MCTATRTWPYSSRAGWRYPHFCSEPRNVFVLLVTDDFVVSTHLMLLALFYCGPRSKGGHLLAQVPVDERQRSSTGWVLMAVNAPASKRHDLGYASVLSVVGGSVKKAGEKGKPMNQSHMLKLIVDELKHLEKASAVTSGCWCSACSASISPSRQCCLVRRKVS